MPSPSTSIEPLVKPLTNFAWLTDRSIDPNSRYSSAFGTPHKAEHYEVQLSMECGEHSADGNFTILGQMMTLWRGVLICQSTSCRLIAALRKRRPHHVALIREPGNIIEVRRMLDKATRPSIDRKMGHLHLCQGIDIPGCSRPLSLNVPVLGDKGY
jgi:hypothetical protein